MRSDVTVSTGRTYDQAVHRYRGFCQAAGLLTVPDPVQVQHFVAALVHANYKLSTIAVTMAGLRRWSSEDCNMPQLVDDSRVQRALKVARKLAVQGTCQKLPLSARDLLEIVGRIAADTPGGLYTAVRDTALFIVGWAGMLRCSELVGLLWEDVHFTASGDIMLFLPRTKTDPSAGSWVLLSATPDAKISPGKALRALWWLSGAGEAVGPVFRPSATASEALKKSTVGPRLKKAMDRAGVPNASLYAAHSLRRGGATHAARVGVPLRFIKLMGRWKSDAVREYLYASPDVVLQQSARMLLHVECVL